MNEATNQIAHALKEIGIWPGDKVALGRPNLPYFPIVCYAILKDGDTPTAGLSSGYSLLFSLVINENEPAEMKE